MLAAAQQVRKQGESVSDKCSRYNLSSRNFIAHTHPRDSVLIPIWVGAAGDVFKEDGESRRDPGYLDPALVGQQKAGCPSKIPRYVHSVKTRCFVRRRHVWTAVAQGECGPVAVQSPGADQSGDLISDTFP